MLNNNQKVILQKRFPGASTLPKQIKVAAIPQQYMINVLFRL